MFKGRTIKGPIGPGCTTLTSRAQDDQRGDAPVFGDGDDASTDWAVAVESHADRYLSQAGAPSRPAASGRAFCGRVFDALRSCDALFSHLKNKRHVLSSEAPSRPKSRRDAAHLVGSPPQCLLGLPNAGLGFTNACCEGPGRSTMKLMSPALPVIDSLKSAAMSRASHRSRDDSGLSISTASASRSVSESNCPTRCADLLRVQPVSPQPCLAACPHPAPAQVRLQSQKIQGMTSRSSPRGRLPSVTSKQPFESVIDQHGATVLRVCQAVVGPHDADDAWSETFLSALKAYPNLPGDANVEAWLVTIAHRKAIDVTRATARRALPLGELPDIQTAPPADDHDLDLADAVTALPAKQKQAVAYHYLAGLPYAEIAQILGGTTDAARRAAADGINTLRRAYPRVPDTSRDARGTPTTSRTCSTTRKGTTP